MRFVDWFAGGGSIRLGLEQAGHECVWSCERDPFARRVYAKRFGHEPESGDIETVRPSDVPVSDLWVGGFPCQDLSVAGRRAGFGGARSALVFRLLDLAAACRPRWLLLENVPGLLSVHEGRDFAVLLGALDDLGYVGAWRVLDARFFGVPQRRRRVFIVCHLGDGGDPGAVLFEPEGVRGDPAARRAAGEAFARPLACGSHGSRNDLDNDTYVVAPPVTAKWSKGSGGPAGDETQNLVAPSLTRSSWKADGKGREDMLVASIATSPTPDVADTVSARERTTYAHAGNNANRLHNVVAVDLVQITHPENRTNPQPGQPAPTVNATSQLHIAAISGLRRGGNHEGGASPSIGDEVGTLGADCRDKHAVAVQETQSGVREYEDAGTLRANGPGHDPVGTRVYMKDVAAVDGFNHAESDVMQTVGAEPRATNRPTMRTGAMLRRLTPLECERLQGLPDGWTKVDEQTSDGPRYKVVGNGAAVPVLRWIGLRLRMEEERCRG